MNSANSNWSYSPETSNLGQNRRLFVPWNLEIWQMTLENNRVPLLCHIKRCATFHQHMWIQTGVTVLKRLNWVFDLCNLELWPMTLTFCMDITSININNSENFNMIRWWEHSEKVWQTDRRTDGRTYRQTDWTIDRAAWSQIKCIQTQCICMYLQGYSTKCRSDNYLWHWWQSIRYVRLTCTEPLVYFSPEIVECKTYSNLWRCLGKTCCQHVCISRSRFLHIRYYQNILGVE